MSPFWVVQRYTPRAQVLALLSARQLERQGYLVQVAEETEGSWELLRAFVVLAVWPRRPGWLEFIRRVSYRFRKSSHRRSSARGHGGPGPSGHSNGFPVWLLTFDLLLSCYGG